MVKRLPSSCKYNDQDDETTVKGGGGVGNSWLSMASCEKHMYIKLVTTCGYKNQRLDLVYNIVGALGLWFDGHFMYRL